MAPEFKEYYDALGVSSDADEQAIKQAYRTLARQYHPDVKPGDKTAEERFKEINEAYQVLSDSEKRRKYDQMRQQYRDWQKYGGGMGGFDWSGGQADPDGFAYAQNLSPEDLEDLFGGQSTFSDFFSSIFGGPGAQERTTQARRGRDVEVVAELTLEEAFHGTMRGIQVGARRIEARIPQGVRTGSRVRLSGQGQPGAAGGPAGDLYLVTHVLPHDSFERDGDDLRCEIPVDIFTAVSGGEAYVRTIDGRVKLEIPPRTQADLTFRLRRKGMPRLGSADERGDMYARVKLVLPEPLSTNEVDTLRNLAQQRQAA